MCFLQNCGVSVHISTCPHPTLRSEGNLLLPSSVSKPLLGRVTAVNMGQRQRTQEGQADSQSFRGGRGTWAGSKGNLKLRLTEGVFLMSLKRVFGEADVMET